MINVHFYFLLDYYGSGRFQTAKDAYSVMLLRNKEALSKGFLLTDKILKDFHFIFLLINALSRNKEAAIKWFLLTRSDSEKGQKVMIFKTGVLDFTSSGDFLHAL